MYIPKYLKIHEVLPPATYDQIKHMGHKAWRYWDERVLIAADLLRVRYGSVLCNNWKAGGSLQYRGFRPADVKIGATMSAHRFFKALDLNFEDATAEEIREDLKAKKILLPINRVEGHVSWLHIDTFNERVESGIKFFNP